MGSFRFGILGAGKIAVKFCEAVRLTPGGEIAAVASKSMERAQEFARKEGIAHGYDDYEELLKKEQPDCVYIAVTPNDHYRLTMMCLKHKIPVICEKAMFQNSREAESAFSLAKEMGTFVMEAMWSRFLPANRTAKQWLMEGRIGEPKAVQCMIGFAAPQGDENRYRNPTLGGGAAKDVTVYAYELTDWMLEQKMQDCAVTAVFGPTGVDLTNHISIRYERTLADLLTSFEAPLTEQMVIYGTNGRIEIPHPHFASECFLYGADKSLKAHFTDTETKNGFVYEIQAAMEAIRAGKIECSMIPHQDTIACAQLFDRIEAQKTKD